MEQSDKNSCIHPFAILLGINMQVLSAGRRDFLPVDDVADDVIDWLLMCGCMWGGVYVS